MNIFRIAWRSIMHRGFGSLLTILSMALGVMLVVSVLSIHGLVSDFFRNNSSFGYNVLVGARGGSLQLTMNTVYYLSQPVENVPYEYYLAFCDAEKREQELRHSLAWETLQNELDSLELIGHSLPGAAATAGMIASNALADQWQSEFRARTQYNEDGVYRNFVDVAIPLCLGDSYQVEGDTETYFRCVGTTPDFFERLVLDIDTEEKFEFAEGRSFANYSDENGYFECVLGALVAKKSGLKIGDRLNPTHGDPNDSGARIHEEGFVITGILKGTRTPHDRAVFLNMNGFFLMDGHAKPVADDASPGDVSADPFDVDPFAADEESFDDEDSFDEAVEDDEASSDEDNANSESEDNSKEAAPSIDLLATPLPIEQREVTSILVRTSKEDEFGLFAFMLPEKINEGTLEQTLNWSNFRPVRAQKAAQAINPVIEVTKFFDTFIGPIQWLLLALTAMICVVSAISILVGIYNSMSQRKHEIAVMRALGASRSKVMSVMLIESILLACAGGLLGWIGGHLLNVAISPFVESQTGVGVSFFDFAPPTPVFAWLDGVVRDATGISFLPDWLLNVNLSPELFLIPSLITLAVLIGIGPAVFAYRTDVAKALGK